ncbi:MAG: hypothetical protein C7B46_19580 [Sulfobacillus benefaciens]|uniref:DUF2442 domain-containing protein n=1 Tax=Sulfobacillus benefaciens TaxID=453960 RepID=A0A2T2WY39_9FIRM|nr:MAG: hypothetical protein C7B46_19580 [Sulfobacillus benefaciens]
MIFWALRVAIDSQTIHVGLIDGRQIQVPLEWFPILRDASPEERQVWEISLPKRVEILFPMLNAEITINQLLAWRQGEDEEAFIVASSSSEQRLTDIAALIRVEMRTKNIGFDECISRLRHHPLIQDQEGQE